MAGNRVQRAAANGLASELVTDWSDRQALHRVPYHCRPAVHQRSRRAPSLDVDLRQAGSGDGLELMIYAYRHGIVYFPAMKCDDSLMVVAPISL